MRPILFAGLAIMLTLGLFGCRVLNRGRDVPTIVIDSPPSGTSFQVGDSVQVRSTATDSQGVTRVELQVDGAVVRTDSSPTSRGQARISIVQMWQAAGPGKHNLVVRAYNASGAFATAGIAITVTENAALAPTSAPGTPGPAACTNNSDFIADITIPDGSVVQPGSGFVKTWRVRNSGTCDWDSSYSIALAEGTPFGTSSAPIPAAAQGALVDISLSMSAPSAPGSYTGTWRLRGGDGTSFGTDLTVVITVPKVNPAAPTRTPAPPPPAPTKTPLPGAPHISSFTCSPCTISAGGTATLNWGPVTGATSASIDQGINGVPTPGSVNVSPTSTTTYTLTATGPGGTSQAAVTIVVTGGFAGHWEHNFGYMDLVQSGSSVTGTVHNSSDGSNGTITGSVSGSILTGTYQENATGPIHQLTLSASGNTFTGNWDTTNQWCGARSGTSFPSGCAFAGHWNARYKSWPDICLMDLTQIASTVTGTYCNGSIQNGAITFTGGYAVLSGTSTGAVSGPFVFYLPVYSYEQFVGHYTPTSGPGLEWCGWRSDSSMPNPCLR
jgi:Ig-like domain from next to BRCA1 gene/Bacterial Ig domain